MRATINNAATATKPKTARQVSNHPSSLRARNSGSIPVTINRHRAPRNSGAFRGGEGGITRRYAPRPFGAALRALSHPASSRNNQPSPCAQNFGSNYWRRGWDSNPRTPVKMLLEFQSSAFDRSATSPINHLRRLSRKLPAHPGRPRRLRKGANNTPSGLGRRLLWHIERGRLIEAPVIFFSRRGCRRVQRREVQSIGCIGRIQPGRNLQGGNAGRPHVRLGVVARTADVSQVLTTRETCQCSHHNSDQHKAIPHRLLPSHGLRPGFNGVRETQTPYE
jgi:hypothetical protein